MGLLDPIKSLLGKDKLPHHLRLGREGEKAAKSYLKQLGYKFLTANYSGPHGEIDLIFRHEDCLVFVEVKTRTEGGWTRPADAVNRDKRKAIIHTARQYVRKLTDSRVKYRYDIAEVLVREGASEVRHIPNAFQE
ncbi:MAG: YraN family protein [Verrucomicrobiales bacterium]|nr:YraN family protein [Verrucomicrobiales bacterium]|tara:strand:+ start:8687 stop:9091 length:405 start_codon:yes stop_codon:yes gene_type:complete